MSPRGGRGRRRKAVPGKGPVCEEARQWEEALRHRREGEGAYNERVAGASFACPVKEFGFTLRAVVSQAVTWNG